MSAKGNEGVAGRIKISEGSVGYVEYGYAQRAGLSLALLENKAGHFVEPDPSNGQAALQNSENDMPSNLRMFLPDPPGEGSYPLVTYTWILLHESYPDTAKGAQVKDFVKGGLCEGQKYSESLGFCILPDHVSKLTLKSVDGIR
jgi:phosphate transport system substrate-binding protein